MSAPEPGTPFDATRTPWRPWSPHEVSARLTDLRVTGRPVRWAVAGGWAVDLYLGRVTRPHEDIEIVVLSADAPAVLAALDSPHWRWDVPLQGRLYPRDSAAFEQTHQTWLWSHQAQGFVLDVFREQHEADTWVWRRDHRLRRPWPEAFGTTQDGTPYLAPEIVLLFKAKHTRDKDVLDLQAALPHLEEHRRTWLRTALQLAHPGHEWLDRL